MRRKGKSPSSAVIPAVVSGGAVGMGFGNRYPDFPGGIDCFYHMPMMEIPKRYVIFKPLGDTFTEAEAPVTVTFLVNADQLAGLVVLANYGRPGFENVSIPFVAGCQAVGILPYREAKSEAPRAVVGNIDISARFYTRKTLGRDVLSFTVPFAMFREMEENVEGSFLTRTQWNNLLET